MSRTRSTSTTGTRPSGRALERLDAAFRVAHSRRELRDALAGLHGEGVRADVLAAMKR